MFRLPVTILSRVGAITMVGYIAWLGWENLGPRRPEIAPARTALADSVIGTVAEDIRTSRGELRRVALLHFANDPTDYFTNMLRAQIEQRGILDLRDRTVTEKARNLLNLSQSSHTTLEAAVAEGRRLDVDGVLYGTVHLFESHPGGADLDVEVHLAEVAGGQPVFSKRYQVDSAAGGIPGAVIGQGTRAFPWFQRFAGWLLAVLLLPVFTIGFIRAMVRKDSNRTNAFVLAVYTLADALLAWLLVGAALGSWLAVLVFIFAVAAAFAYNIRIMAFAVRLEEA